MVAESQSSKTGISQEKERSVRTGWLIGLFSLLPTILAVVIGHSTTLLAGLFKMVCETFASFLAWLSLRKVARWLWLKNYRLGRTERLAEVVRAHATLSAQELVEAIEAAVTAFAGQAPQSDNLTLLVIRCLPSGSND